MRKSSKKSALKSKKGKRKSPLKKYLTAGAVTPPTIPTTTFGSGNLGTGGLNSGYTLGNTTLGSTGITGATTSGNSYNMGNSWNQASSDINTLNNNFALTDGNPLTSAYSGSDYSLDRTKPTTLNSFRADQEKAVSGKQGESNLQLEKSAPKELTSQDKAAKVLSAIPGGITGIVGNALTDTTIRDDKGYYSKKTKDKLESYNRKIKAAKTASSVGQGISMAGAALTGTVIGAPLGALISGIGGITTAVSEGFAADYGNKQGDVDAAYGKSLAQRQEDKEEKRLKREQNLTRSQESYYDLPTVRDGGMMKYQVGGLKREAPLEEEVSVVDPAMDVLMNGGIRKYMAGGYQKVTGPSHENGGVAMDLDADGAVDSELEGGEIIEEMKHGGNASKKYIWSDHLKTGGMSFAKKFEQERKRGATPRRIEKLRVEQELAAKRDPSKLYKKYGGMMKYKSGGTANFEPHMMYDPKTGKGVKANTYEKHLELKNKSYDHREREEKSMGGMMKYGYGGKMEYMKEGGKLPKEVLESRLESHMSEGEAQDYIDSYKGGGLWANIHAKRKRIADGSGEKMRQPGSEGAPSAKALRESKKDGGLMEYQTGGQRVSRTGAGKFFAEYGAPLANVAGEAVNIGMNLSQEYNPVETISAPDVKAEKVFIDRAKDLRVGARESELINAKRSLQMGTGPKNAALNSARMVSLRAQEEAAQNVYDQNRQASSTEQQLNQAAQLKAAMTNQANARLESESRRNEGLRKESFENMRKKYIGSAASGLGNQLAQGMYTKEYINATLPDGVNPYAIKPNAIPNKMKEINPATGKKYTNAEATNAVLIQYRLENP